MRAGAIVPMHLHGARNCWNFERGGLGACGAGWCPPWGRPVRSLQFFFCQKGREMNAR